MDYLRLTTSNTFKPYGDPENKIKRLKDFKLSFTLILRKPPQKGVINQKQQLKLNFLDLFKFNYLQHTNVLRRQTFILTYTHVQALTKNLYLFVKINSKVKFSSTFSYKVCSFSQKIIKFIPVQFKKTYSFVTSAHPRVSKTSLVLKPNELFQEKSKKKICISHHKQNKIFLKDMSWVKLLIFSKPTDAINKIHLTKGDSTKYFHRNMFLKNNLSNKTKYAISYSPKKKELLLQTFISLYLQNCWARTNTTNRIYYLPLTLGFKYSKFFSSNASSQIGDITAGLSCIEKIFEARYSIYSFPISKFIGIIIYIPTQNFEETSKNFYLKFGQELGFNTNISWCLGQTLTPITILIKKTEILYGGFVLGTHTHSFNKISENFFKSSLLSKSLYTSTKNTFIYSFNLILESILKQYSHNGINIHSLFFELIIKRMISCVKIINNFDSTCFVGDKVKFTIINLINLALNKHGYYSCKYKPMILGITKANLACSGLLASISFQDITKILINASFEKKLDWFTDLKSQIIIADLIAAGSGWVYKFNSS